MSLFASDGSYQEQEAPDVVNLSERIHVRRREPVRCDGCRKDIVAGQRYRCYAYTEDGTFGYARFHLLCPFMEDR